MIEDEKEHYRELGSLLRGHYTAPAGAPKVDPKAVLDEMLAKRNAGRKQPGAWIGDAIYGVNDGLGAIFGIVSGVSGATAGDSKYVLLAGLSGMIASALSMGSGAYLAAKSEREIYHAEIAREREAIAMNGPEARELLSLYYQVKGLPEADAMHMVDHIASDPEQLLRALATERLGTSEEALSNPLVSASSGALSTAVGAIIPVIPFFFMSGIDGGDCGGGGFAAGAFCGGRGQEPDHGAVVVVVGIRDDDGGCGGRRGHVRHRHSAGQGRHLGRDRIGSAFAAEGFRAEKNCVPAYCCSGIDSRCFALRTDNSTNRD